VVPDPPAPPAPPASVTYEPPAQAASDWPSSATALPQRLTGRLIGALKLILTQPFDIDTVPKIFRGDYINISLTLDLTYSAVDNAFLTGTGLSGALRALEQSYGRDPETMIPDVRYTPNPNDAPGGPLVERGDRNC